LAACPNRMDPPASQVSLNQMDRVEILKGPYFLRYGPALGGTINFITQDPSFKEKFEPGGRLSSSYESNGNIFRTEGAVGINERRFVFGINGSWSKGDDYKDGDGIVVPSRFSRGSLGTHLAYRLPGRQFLAVNVTRNFARDVIFASLPMDLRNDDTWLVNAKHQISIDGSKLKQWSTTAYLTHVSHLMDNLEKVLDPRTVNAITDATTRTFGGRTEGLLEYPMTKVYLGADLRMEEAEGIRIREMLAGPMSGRTFEDNVWQNGRISKTALFAEYQINHHPLELVFSGRLEVNDAKLRDTASEFTDVYEDTQTVQLNPSISMGVKNQLASTFSMGLWLGRSQRSGSLTERYINFFPVGLDPYELLGNPLIKPEVNNQADLNLVFEIARTSLRLDIFSAFLQDFISSEIRDDLDPRLPSSPGVRQFVNIDRALMTGFEMSWEQHLPYHMDLLAGMAYTYGKDLVEDEPLPEIAPLDLRVGLSGHFIDNALRPEIQFRHVIKQERVAQSYGETVTPGFSTVDLKLTYDILRVLHVAGGVRNIFDVAFYEHLSRSVRDAAQRPIYAPGRNIFLTISLDLTD
jgi:iron complex outermembrane receptor protein